MGSAYLHDYKSCLKDFTCRRSKLRLLKERSCLQPVSEDAGWKEDEYLCVILGVGM